MKDTVLYQHGIAYATIMTATSLIDGKDYPCWMEGQHLVWFGGTVGLRVPVDITQGETPRYLVMRMRRRLVKKGYSVTINKTEIPLRKTNGSNSDFDRLANPPEPAAQAASHEEERPQEA